MEYQDPEFDSPATPPFVFLVSIFFGKKLPIIGKANSVHQQGNKNSQYGTCWIFNEKLKQNKKIKKEDMNG